TILKQPVGLQWARNNPLRDFYRRVYLPPWRTVLSRKETWILCAILLLLLRVQSKLQQWVSGFGCWLNAILILPYQQFVTFKWLVKPAQRNKQREFVIELRLKFKPRYAALRPERKIGPVF